MFVYFKIAPYSTKIVGQVSGFVYVYMFMLIANISLMEI